MTNLGSIYRSQKNFGKAEQLHTTVLEARRRLLGEEHPHTLRSGQQLALVYSAERKYEQAETLQSKILITFRKVLGEEHRSTLSVVTDLAATYQAQGRYAESENLLRRQLSIYERKTPDAWQTFNCQSMLGASLAAQRKHTDAELFLLSGYQGFLRHQATMPAIILRNVEVAGHDLVQLYQDLGKPAEAAMWKKMWKKKLTASK